MPRHSSFDHISDYVAEEESFSKTLEYRSVGPPLLAAGVRQQVLQRMLRFKQSDRVFDCGCGNGKFSLWNHESVALMVGLDPATFFADAALDQVDLVQGDARQTPFATGSFDKAFSIDVFEHLTRPDLEAVLAEVCRVLRPGGRLLIYSNTREPSSLQPLVELWRRIGRWLRKRGWATPDRYALPKSDHVKVIETYEALVDLVQEQGFGVVEVRFWNSVFTSFVEHVLVPVTEQILLRRTPASSGEPSSKEEFSPQLTRERQEGPSHWRERASQRGPFYWAARTLTWFMGLDLLLFGRLRSGSYFLLLECL
jgi:ubiquinone/menaquinone biosynthesis C-methylase UbiE